MVGILVVTHNNLGEVLIDTAFYILDEKFDAVQAISIHLQDSTDQLRKKVKAGIRAVNKQHGVLILTDMFGGTPSNLGYSFLEEGQIEVLSGVNLPILVKALDLREKLPLLELSKELEKTGKKSITLASDILKGNKRTTRTD